MAACVAGAVVAGGCVTRLERAITRDIRTVDASAPYLKAHMNNGDVYLLTSWRVTTAEPIAVIGTGQLMGVDRAVVREGTFRVPVSEVSLFETNEVSTSPNVSALAVVSVVSIALTAACIANPKSCFGSCPTFYGPTPGGGAGGAGEVLEAEGFSDSIAPALEASDVDALWRTSSSARDGGTLALRMTNEAYETHVVKAADLLAVPRPRGGRVFHAGGGEGARDEFWPARAVVAPAACRALEGDCAARVHAVDGIERISTTDEHDLAARETIELDFATPAAAKRVGIAIATRQTLVTTFLLYQGLAWLGSDATTWLAAGAGQGHAPSRARHLTGGIEVQVPDAQVDGGWRTVGEIYETGPIGTDVHLVVLPEGARGERIRLRLPRGGWRIDAVMLAALDDAPVTPQRIAPEEIRGTLSRDYGLGRTAATGFPIVTVPGDAYTLTYPLPRGDVELFLESRGYYLEWMREEWMHERDPIAAMRMLADPDAMLRELAPRFKQLEPHMEEIFWRSRYARP